MDLLLLFTAKPLALTAASLRLTALSMRRFLSHGSSSATVRTYPDIVDPDLFVSTLVNLPKEALTPSCGCGFGFGFGGARDLVRFSARLPG